jgi:hypothetical protein
MLIFGAILWKSHTKISTLMIMLMLMLMMIMITIMLMMIMITIMLMLIQFRNVSKYADSVRVAVLCRLEVDNLFPAVRIMRCHARG